MTRYDPARGDRESRLQPGLWLTAHRLRILDALANGRLHKQIALDLGISVPTVREHVQELKRLLGVGNDRQLIAEGYHHGFLPLRERDRPDHT